MLKRPEAADEVKSALSGYASDPYTLKKAFRTQRCARFMARANIKGCSLPLVEGICVTVIMHFENFRFDHTFFHISAVISIVRACIIYQNTRMTILIINPLKFRRKIKSEQNYARFYEPNSLSGCIW